MQDPHLGEIMLFAGNFAPEGWAFCNGQMLPIAQNQALFSILGTTYGGNGQTTFGLPDLRGRTPIHFGQGPGLTPKTLGKMGGEEEVTLTVNQIPAHSHVAELYASQETASSGSPVNNTLANTMIYDSSAPEDQMSNKSVIVRTTGGSEAHTNMQPYLAINYCIALQGIYPSRS